MNELYSRRHTVAFAPQSGRVYSFGLGAYGQLGSGGTNSCNSPVVASGPWTSSMIRIVAGGDHCFVLTANRDAGVSFSAFNSSKTVRKILHHVWLFLISLSTIQKIFLHWLPDTYESTTSQNLDFQL